MTHKSGNLADIRERLRAYARALDVELDDHGIETILTGGSDLAGSLEQLRKRLAAGFRGDFLAFRLWHGLEAQLDSFRQPAMARQAFPSARLGNIALRDPD